MARTSICLFSIFPIVACISYDIVNAESKYGAILYYCSPVMLILVSLLIIWCLCLIFRYTGENADMPMMLTLARDTIVALVLSSIFSWLIFRYHAIIDDYIETNCRRTSFCPFYVIVLSCCFYLISNIILQINRTKNYKILIFIISLVTGGLFCIYWTTNIKDKLRYLL